MTRVTLKQVFGWVLFGLILFIPTIMLAISKEYISDVLGIIGLVFVIVLIVGLAGNLISSKNK